MSEQQQGAKAAVPIDLRSTYLSIDGKGRVATHLVDAEFWPTIASNTSLLDSLVGLYEGTADWPHWEMHPGGEEILFLVEGAMTLVLEDAGGESRMPFEAGKAIIIPRGVWHRALVARPSKFIGITYGAGTQHKPL